MFYFSGIVIGIFLTAILLSKKGKTQADRILTAWLLITTLNLFMFYLYITNIQYEYPFVLGIIFPLPLFQGPLLYLYTKSLTSKKRLDGKVIMHVIPVLFSILLFTRFYLLPAESKIEIFRNEGAGYEGYLQINFVMIVLSGFCYTMLAIYTLRRYRIALKNEFSYTEKINLNWLKYLIIGTSVIWFIIIFGTNDNQIYYAVVIYMVLLGFFGINQVGVFSQNTSELKLAESRFQDKKNYMYQTTAKIKAKNEAVNTTDLNLASVIEPKRAKYEKSILSENAASEIYDALTRVMREQHPYKKSEITLSELAQILEVHPNYLSQVINSVEGKNFFDYINDCRIEEFKRIVHLPENKKYTLLSIAFECGFNSKTAFNRSFKKATGLSPSDYLATS